MEVPSANGIENTSDLYEEGEEDMIDHCSYARNLSSCEIKT